MDSSCSYLFVYLHVKVCIPAFVCVCVCVCLSLTDRIFIDLMFNVIWHSIAVVSLAFTHNTNNSTTPCDTVLWHNQPEFTVAHQWKKKKKNPNWKHRELDMQATSGGFILKMSPLRPTEVRGSLSFFSKKGTRTLHCGFLLLLSRPVDISVKAMIFFRVDEYPLLAQLLCKSFVFVDLYIHFS